MEWKRDRQKGKEILRKTEGGETNLGENFRESTVLGKGVGVCGAEGWETVSWGLLRNLGWSHEEHLA